MGAYRPPFPFENDFPSAFCFNRGVHFLGDLPTECEKLLSESSDLFQEFWAAYPETEKSERKICAADFPSQRQELDDGFWYIRDGSLRASFRGQLCYILQAGDRLYLGEHLEVQADMDLWLEGCGGTQLFGFLAGNSGARDRFRRAERAFQDALISSIQALTMGLMPPEMETLSLEAHKTIIAEGEKSSDVFQMIEGAANVVSGGVQVGEIGPGQIFGAIAAFTDSPRTASVITSKPSLVMKTPKSQFLELARSRPATVATLVEDLSQALKSLNKKYVEIGHKKA